MWKAPALGVSHAQNSVAAERPRPLSLPSSPASRELCPIPTDIGMRGCTQIPPVHPETFPCAGGEPLPQPPAPRGRARGAEPVLREPVPGVPRVPGHKALLHLAAAARRDAQHHPGALRQRPGRSRPSRCRGRSPRCRQPRSDRLVPQERNISGKLDFQCQHGPEECLGNMIEVTVPVPMVLARRCPAAPHRPPCPCRPV